MAGRGTYPWVRLTHPVEVEPARDSNGWVIPWPLWQHAGVVPLSGYRDVPVVALLGERGFGKSDALAHECEDLESAGVEDPVLLDLKALSTRTIETRVGTALSPGWDGLRWVLLDGLDDAPAAAEIDRMLIGALHNLGDDHRQRLRLRVSCRTSLWPTLLGETIEKLWGDGFCRVHIAGLTRQDALVAAQLRGLDSPEEFVSNLERQRLVVPLASWPMTFVPLLESTAGHAPLPRTVSQAYAAACHELCLEKDSGTLDNPRQGATPAKDLLPLAQRAAAVLQFCARDALSLSHDDPEAVSLDELATGTEHLEGGGDAQCTVAAYRDLTQSGLLAPTQPVGRWAFAHRSFQEYLAAQYLHRNKTPDPVRRALLLVGDGLARRAATNQRGVSAWLAVCDDVLFDALVSSDPGTLLLGDLGTRNPLDRIRVLDALFDRVRHGDVVDVEHALLHQLDSDLIAERLAPHLNAGVPPEELRFALSIADVCPHTELTEHLLDVAENHGLHPALRCQALNALSQMRLGREYRDNLVVLAQDEDPDVAAHALTQLWPDSLTTAEMLAWLPLPKPEYLGQAAALLQRLPAVLRDADTLDAVQWSAKALTSTSAGTHESIAHTELAVRLVARAIAADTTPADPWAPTVLALKNSLLAFVKLSPTSHLMSATDELADALDGNAPVRRALARAALDSASDDQIRRLCWRSPVRLFHGSHDSGYWAGQLPSLPSAQQALLEWPLMPLPASVEDWEDAYELKQQGGRLAKLISHWYMCPLDTPAAQAVRERMRWEREHAVKAQAMRDDRRYDETALRGAIAAVHQPGGDTRSAWQHVLVCLHRTTAGDSITLADRLDPTSAASFPAQGSPLYPEVLRAAETAVLTVPTTDPLSMGGHGTSLWPDATELMALALLDATQHTLPDLKPDQWARMAITLMCAQVDASSMAQRNRLLLDCARRSKGIFETLLPKALDRLGPAWLNHTMALMPTPLSELQQQALLTWAQVPRRSAQQAMPVLRYLVKQGHPSALATLRSMTKLQPSKLRGSTTGTAVHRWLGSAEILLQVGDVQVWPAILDTLERVPQLTMPLLKVLTDAVHVGTPLARIDEVSDTNLVRLYSLLADHSGERSHRPAPGAMADVALSLSHQLRGLLHGVLHAITTKPGSQAPALIRSLARLHPDDTLLPEALRTVERLIADRTWAPVSNVSDLVKVTVTKASRLANDQYQLRDIVLESLDRLQTQLRTSNAWSTALWNQDRVRISPKKIRTIWWPTWENDFSDFVATFLRYDLAGHKVVVNREVELERPGLGGSRTDIEIQAHALDRVSGPEPLKVIIEAKGCWHPDLSTGLTQQLVKKYLAIPGPSAGIYLIAYCDDPVWRKAGRENDRKHAEHTIKAIREEQLALAAAAQQAAPVTVTAVVLDCRLPGSRVKEEVVP